jgi:hypothetical protein
MLLRTGGKKSFSENQNLFAKVMEASHRRNTSNKSATKQYPEIVAKDDFQKNLPKSRQTSEYRVKYHKVIALGAIKAIGQEVTLIPLTNEPGIFPFSFIFLLRLFILFNYFRANFANLIAECLGSRNITL